MFCALSAAASARRPTEPVVVEQRAAKSNAFRIGYVGRLTPEKNVRFLATLGAHLQAKGHRNFEFVMVGEGSEQNAALARAVLGGISVGTCSTLLFVPFLYATLRRGEAKPLEDYV